MLVEATNNTRKFVLPVCKMPVNGDGGYDLEKAELGGTCFLVGRRGFALTAAHVIRDIGPDEARVFFPVAGEWDVCPITQTEFHPEEDICIIKVDLPEEVVSPVIFAADEPFPGCEYNMWAYPDVMRKK